MQSHFLRRVQIKNYKSIQACSVHLKAPLAILVGPNGSGKSNFLDALRLISDSLNTTLEQALRDRGGVNEVRRRSGGHPTHFTVQLDFTLRSGLLGFFAFEIAATSDGDFVVSKERCEVFKDMMTGGDHYDDYYEVDSKRDSFDTSLSVAMPPVLHDRLYLTNAGSVKPFDEVFDALRSMGFYNLNPGVIREFQRSDPGTLLERDGRNLASVLARLDTHHSEIMETIKEYLAAVVPGVEGAGRLMYGPRETVQFLQRVPGQKHPWKFSAINMSDGTLRALGVIVALLQTNSRTPSVVGIEEPETALHPAASGVLWEEIWAAAQKTQVLVTSHSADLLDRDSISPDALLGVSSEANRTSIGPLNERARDLLRKKLCTPGELMRQRETEPDEESQRLARRPSNLRLFSPCPE